MAHHSPEGCWLGRYRVVEFERVEAISPVVVGRLANLFDVNLGAVFVVFAESRADFETLAVFPLRVALLEVIAVAPHHVCDGTARVAKAAGIERLAIARGP